MSEPAADLHMLNVIVWGMAASLDFYRRLGVAVPDDVNPADAHVQLRMPGGFSLELDSRVRPAAARRRGAAADGPTPAKVDVVIGFAPPSREAVDQQRYAELTAARYTGRQPEVATGGIAQLNTQSSGGHAAALVTPG